MLEQPHAANILHTGNGDADAAMGGAVLAAGEPLRELGGGFAKGYDGAAATLAAPALLTVRAADCVPVLAVDPERGAYGALHAGWRGIAAGILPNLLAGWREAGSSLGAVRLAFGPGIRVCCFEVQADCLGAFDVALLADTVQRVGGATHLDLVGVLRGQARAVGLSDEQVEVLPYCTTCHQDGAGEFPFASYRRSRRDGTRTPGRNASFIGVPVASAGH